MSPNRVPYTAAMVAVWTTLTNVIYGRNESATVLLLASLGSRLTEQERTLIGKLIRANPHFLEGLRIPNGVRC
jgi:hypothetical protein